MKTNALFIALLWRTVVAYLLLALAVSIGLAALFAIGIELPSRNVSVSVPYIKFKPTLAYLGFALLLLTSEFGLHVNVVRVVAGKRLGLPPSAWRQYLIELSGLFVALAILNVLVALAASVEAWINYKLFGALTLLLVGIYVLAMRTSKLAAVGK